MCTLNKMAKGDRKRQFNIEQETNHVLHSLSKEKTKHLKSYLI